MQYPVLYALIGFFLYCIIGCTTTQSVSQKNRTSKKLPEIIYYVDTNQDGNYEATTPSSKPIPNQGYDQWARDFYSAIKYPPSARHNGTSGLVLLGVLINEFGQVVEVGIKQNLSHDCDEAAMTAYRKSTIQGYSAALVDGIAWKCRMDIPVGFWLN